MEKAYIGIMGGYNILKEGDEKHEPTHIVLTNDEYNRLIKAKNSYKARFEKERLAHTDDIEKLKQKASDLKKIWKRKQEQN